LVSWLVS